MTAALLGVDLGKSQLAKDLELAGAEDLGSWLIPQNNLRISTSPIGSQKNGHISLRRENPASAGASFRQSSGQEPRLVLSVGVDPNMVPIQLSYDPKTGDRVGISVEPGGRSGMNHYNNHGQAVDALLRTTAGLVHAVGTKGLFVAYAAKAVGAQDKTSGRDYTHNAAAAWAHLDPRNVEVAHAAIGAINNVLHQKAGPAPRF